MQVPLQPCTAAARDLFYQTFQQIGQRYQLQPVVFAEFAALGDLMPCKQGPHHYEHATHWCAEQVVPGAEGSWLVEVEEAPDVAEVAGEEEAVGEKEA